MKNWADYLVEAFIFLLVNFIAIAGYLIRIVLTNEKKIKVLENEIKSQNKIREVQQENMGRRQDELLAAVIKLQDSLSNRKK